MKVRIDKLTRPLRRVTALTAVTVLVVCFQNCAPQAQCSSSSSSTCSTDSSSSTNSGSTSSNKSPSQSSNLVIGGGSSSGNSSSSGSSSSGAITVGGGSSSSGSGSSSGGSSSSGSSSGAISVGGSGSGTSNGFQITKQPVGVTVMEKQDISLEVGVSGGKTPYTFQWYKDGAALSLGTYSFYMDNADTWRKEGVYYVKIKDATGASLTSQSVRVGISEPTTGCNAGNYFTYTNATYDQGYQYFSLYYDGPRGKFLTHQSYDSANIVFQFGGYAGLSYWSFPKMTHLQTSAISCSQNVPRIHAAQSNPGGWGNTCWQYQGSVNFECHNNKIKFVSDTCRWVEIANCSSN